MSFPCFVLRPLVSPSWFYNAAKYYKLLQIRQRAMAMNNGGSVHKVNSQNVSEKNLRSCSALLEADYKPLLD